MMWFRDSAYYCLTGGSGDWSTEGCHLASFSNGTAMCECNHLTSFAILFVSFAHVLGCAILSFFFFVGRFTKG